MKAKSKAAADNRWNAKNMKQVKANLRKEVAEAFAARCKERGTTMHAVLKAAVIAYMEEPQK